MHALRDLSGRPPRLLPAIFAAGLLLLIAAAASGRPAAAAPAPRDVTLLFFTDFHGALVDGGRDRDTQRPWGGAVALEQLVRQERWRRPERTFTLDGGDEMQGTPESNFFFGRSAVMALNDLGAEAAALGNHDFDWGIDTLRARVRDMHYVMLAANVFEKASGQRPAWVRPYVVLRRDGVRLGVIGLATPETPRVTLPSNVESLRFDDPVPLLPGLVREVRRQGVDLVVLLCHFGAFKERDGTIHGPLADLALAAHGVDAILGGHTHSFVAAQVNGIPLLVAGSSGRCLGRIVLHWDGRRVEGSDVALLRAYSDSLAVPRWDPIATLVDSLRRRVQPIVARVLGHTASNVSGDALANLVSDAMRRAAGADIAITNSGSLRRELGAGDVTAGDVFELMPFENTLATVRLTGRELLDLLEIRPGSMRLSGLRGRYDPNAPQGQRLSALQLDDGSPLRPDSTYRVVTNNFLAQGGDGMVGFEKGQGFVMMKTLVRDAITEAIEAESSSGRDLAPDPKPRLVSAGAPR